MFRLKSQIDVKSADFGANVDAMSAIVADLREKIRLAAAGGSTKAVEKHRDRGRLLARERIDLLKSLLAATETGAAAATV